MSDEADRPEPAEPSPAAGDSDSDSESASASVDGASAGAVGTEREPVVRRAVVTTGDTTVIARTIARIVAPIVVLTAIALTLRGHNLPGGGFIGGVLTAIAFALLYVVYSLDYVHERLVSKEGGRHPTRLLFAVGLALALFSGLVPVLLGGPFLTQGFILFAEPLPGPFFHEFEVATALAFDLGVYFVVVGGLLTIVREVGAE
jgi:multicomponent Na+:H+ antiporter subunit B